VVENSICLDSEMTWAIAWTEENNVWIGLNMYEVFYLFRKATEGVKGFYSSNEEKLGAEDEDVFSAKTFWEVVGKLFDKGHMMVAEDMPVEGYDDHGQVEFVSSYMGYLRLDMRRTSKAVQGWDEEIPADFRQKWIKNFDDASLIKLFKCESCKKQFTKREILKRHIKTHMKKKSLNVSIVSRPLTGEMC
jgi:hypothetical protein